MYGLEGRYAHALYSAACKQDSLAHVENEISSIQEKFASGGSLANFCVDPSIKVPPKVVDVRGL